MKKSFADRLLGAVAVGSIVISYAAPAVTVTFEGMVTPPATSISLTTQISGVTFLQEERFLAAHAAPDGVDPAPVYVEPWECGANDRRHPGDDTVEGASPVRAV